MPRVSEAYLEARRVEVLDAAWACLARKGYHQTTMQDICEESRLSYGAIYRYFKSKEDILIGIFDRFAEVSRQIVAQAQAESEGPQKTLETIGRVTFAFFDQPNFESVTRTDIEIWPEIIRNPLLLAKFRAQINYWQNVVTDLLTESQRRGELRADVDPKVVATLDMCVFEGLRRYRLIDPENFDPEPLRQLLDTLSQRGGRNGDAD